MISLRMPCDFTYPKKGSIVRFDRECEVFTADPESSGLTFGDPLSFTTTVDKNSVGIFIDHSKITYFELDVNFDEFDIWKILLRSIKIIWYIPRWEREVNSYTLPNKLHMDAKFPIHTLIQKKKVNDK